MSFNSTTSVEAGGVEVRIPISPEADVITDWPLIGSRLTSHTLALYPTCPMLDQAPHIQEVDDSTMMVVNVSEAHAGNSE